jgi:hypothetical protein
MIILIPRVRSLKLPSKRGDMLIKIQSKYTIWLITGLLVQALTAVTFFIFEGIRRSGAEFFGECTLCFLLEFSLISVILGGVCATRKHKLLRIFSILAILATLVSNVLFLIQTYYLKYTTELLSPEMAAKHNVHWIELNLFEMALYLSSLALLIAAYMLSFRLIAKSNSHP